MLKIINHCHYVVDDGQMDKLTLYFDRNTYTKKVIGDISVQRIIAYGGLHRIVELYLKHRLTEGFDLTTFGIYHVLPMQSAHAYRRFGPDRNKDGTFDWENDDYSLVAAAWPLIRAIIKCVVMHSGACACRRLRVFSTSYLMKDLDASGMSTTSVGGHSFMCGYLNYFNQK